MSRLAILNGLVLAFETIRTHKLRAFLTVLGVIIGTGTIIGVAAILTGFDATVTGVLSSFGPNSIIVFKFPVGPRTTMQSPLRWAASADWKLDYLNLDRISPEELARRRAEFDRQKELARPNRVEQAA